jgi:hypothetical protein
MTQYIPKSALLAEIERRIKTNKECMLGLKNLDYYQGKVDALNDTISLLDTLEVKEIQVKESAEIERDKETCKENGSSLTLDGVITFDYYDGDKAYGCVAHDSFCLEDWGLKDMDKVKILILKK